MNVRKNARRFASVAVSMLGLATAGPAMADADLVVTGALTSPKTGNVGLGKSASTGITIKNTGTETAKSISVSLDTSAWAESGESAQVITGITGCTPAVAKPSKNSEWFPCALKDPLKTETDLAEGVKSNAVTVTIAVTYGTAKKATDIYNEDGTKKGTWTCPAADLFKPLIATAATTTTEADTSNNTATVAAPHALWADLSIEMTGPDSVPHSGGTFTYNVVVTNNGPCTVSSKFTLDGNVTTGFKFASADGACADLTDDSDADGNALYCPAANLAPGASVSATKTYKAPALPDGLIHSNQGTGVVLKASDYADPFAGNDTSDVTYDVRKDFGCSSVGGSPVFALLGLSLFALFVRRSRTA